MLMTHSTPKRQKKFKNADWNGRDASAPELLLKATSELLIELGVHNVTLKDIGERSGVDPALVSYYFGNKAGLMMGLLRMILSPAIEQMRALPSLAVPPHEKLRIHVTGMINVYFHYPFVNRLMHQLQMDDMDYFGPKIAAEISGPVAEVQAKILDEGVAQGLFKPIEPMMFYVQVIGACDQLFTARYQLEYIFATTQVDAALKRRFVDHFVEILLHGICARSAPPASD